MYTPAAFVLDRAAAEAAIDACDLAAVVATGPDGFEATWLPLMRDGDRLVGHVAKANGLWRMEGAVVAMFRTLDGYVSPSWYPSKREHGKVVPTWNYVAVNVHGTLRARQDADWKRAVVTALTQRHEARVGSDWTVDDAPADYLDGMLGAVVGIEITIDRVEGKAKLSQNRPAADIEGVIAANPGPLGDAVRAAAEHTAR